MIIKITLIGFLIFAIIAPICKGGDKIEITVDNAIQIAKEFANEDKYNVAVADVEVIKVKKKIEKGPIRIVWLMQYFSGEELEALLEKEFWIIYFYPKGQLENPRFLGGDFYAFIDLYSGEVLASFAGQ